MRANSQSNRLCTLWKANAAQAYDNCWSEERLDTCFNHIPNKKKRVCIAAFGAWSQLVRDTAMRRHDSGALPLLLSHHKRADDAHNVPGERMTMSMSALLVRGSRRHPVATEIRHGHLHMRCPHAAHTSYIFALTELSLPFHVGGCSQAGALRRTALGALPALLCVKPLCVLPVAVQQAGRQMTATCTIPRQARHQLISLTHSQCARPSS